MVDGNRVMRAKNADLNNGIHSTKNIKRAERVPVLVHQNRYADIWRAIVASGSKGLVIPLWWFMGDVS